MTVRRGLVLLALVVAVGLAIAGVTAPGAAPAAHAPTVTVPGVQAGASSCYAAGHTCSIHPCVQFVAAKPARPLARARLTQPRFPICDRYPSAIPEAVPARR
jgi:hypothetical protein